MKQFALLTFFVFVSGESASHLLKKSFLKFQKIKKTKREADTRSTWSGGDAFERGGAKEEQGM